MSSSDYIAAFTVNGNSPHYLEVFKGMDGIPTNGPRQIDEELITPGTNYARWRKKFTQYGDKRFQAWQECTGGDDLQNQYRRYEAAVNQFGTLVWLLRGVPRTWKNVKVIDITAQDPIPSPLYGAGASGSGLLIAVSVWTLRFTQQSDSA